MKKKILELILELTEAQYNAISTGDVETFDQLTQQRQEQMDAIDRLHEEQPEYKAQKEEELLQLIIQKDNQNRKLYEAEYHKVQDKLNKLRARRRVNNVYSNPYTIAREEGIFFDKGR